MKVVAAIAPKPAMKDSSQIPTSDNRDSDGAAPVLPKATFCGRVTPAFSFAEVSCVARRSEAGQWARAGNPTAYQGLAD